MLLIENDYKLGPPQDRTSLTNCGIYFFILFYLFIFYFEYLSLV